MNNMNDFLLPLSMLPGAHHPLGSWLQGSEMGEFPPLSQHPC